MMTNHPNRKRKTATSGISPAAKRAAARPTTIRPPDFRGILDGVQAMFRRVDGPLFLTDAAEELNGIYLDALPQMRQYHSCSACRAFLKRYGSLAMIAEDGQLVPAMWEPNQTSPFYREAVLALHNRVKRADVTGVFFAKERVWGTAESGGWEHFCVRPSTSLVFEERALTPHQAAAAVGENVNTVRHALIEYPASAVAQLIRLLESEHLERSDKFVGPAKWLLALHGRPKGRRGENVLWRAVATAPEGFCHVKSSAIGPLLDDIVAGVPFHDIKRKHEAKMHPLRYQRPQAAPAAGNVAAAEKLFEKLGLAPALERRFARLDEIEAIWAPADEPKPRKAGGDVFAHLKTKGERSAPPISIPPTTVTWEKFARVALPGAERIEMLVPPSGNFIAMTTAVDAGAPPLLKWDDEERRNPVAWYVYNNGSAASQWGLRPGEWTPVTAVAAFPNLWGDKPMPFMFDGAILVLEGAVDRHDAGNALFPEILRGDVHGARATIEAYSRDAKLSGRSEASACGYAARKGVPVDVTVRVFSNGSWAAYRIDRWD